MTMRAIMAMTILFLAGCGSVELSREGRAVRVLASVPQQCTELGDVTGSKFCTTFNQGDCVTGAKNELRNNAGEMAANAVVIQTNNQIVSGNGSNVTFGGVAYRCPAEAMLSQPRMAK